MSEGRQPWMRDYHLQHRARSLRPKIRVGISEVIYGERGREVAFLRDTAILIEKLGFDTLWFPEHVVFFEEYTSKYPYGSVGGNEVFRKRQELDNPGLRGIFDGPIAIVAAASVTSKLRFGTFVTILPQRNPVVFAREIATVDHLSSGRYDFGVGVGWSKEEYEACQTPFVRRGDRMDDYIKAMKCLWTEDLSSYDGDFVSFQNVMAFPKPLQRPHPPILVGGQSQRGIARAAELGDGVIFYNLDIEDVEKALEFYEDELAKHDKSIDHAKVVVGRRNEVRSQESWESDATYIQEIQKLGVVTDVVCSPRFPTEGYVEAMTGYAEVVLNR